MLKKQRLVSEDVIYLLRKTLRVKMEIVLHHGTARFTHNYNKHLLPASNEHFRYTLTQSERLACSWLNRKTIHGVARLTCIFVVIES